MKTSVCAGVPEAARALMWEIFFASRSRGISLVAHFPWIADPAQVSCVSIESPGDRGMETCATLALRRVEIEGVGPVGLVGLVCVRPDSRGKGLSGLLLVRTVELAETMGLTALILWTGKPGVYHSHGFVIDSQDQFGTVSRDVAIATEPALGGAEVSELRGMPPFATSVRAYTKGAAQITVMSTPYGECLAEWQGPRASVVELIGATMPRRWRLNAPAGEPLLGDLASRGYTLAMEPTSFRMLRQTGGKVLPVIPYINVLDRV